MATTNLEIYRRFEGELRSHPLRFWPVLVSSIRVGCKKKLWLLVLYAIPTIATVIYSFVVFTRYAAEAQMMPEALGGGSALADMLARRALERLAVRNQIANFNSVIQFFALVTAAWYGAGLLVEDWRVGAHQLYFSRPLTRLDYFLGKFFTASFFSALAVLVPGLVICLVASFASYQWAFLKDDYDVILGTIAYSAIWVTVTSSVALCASSLSTRRIFAMVGFFAFFLITFALSGILAKIQSNEDYFAISPLWSVRQVAELIFGIDDGFPNVSSALAWGVLAATTGISLAIVAWRLRRLEVVA